MELSSSDDPTQVADWVTGASRVQSPRRICILTVEDCAVYRAIKTAIYYVEFTNWTELYYIDMGSVKTASMENESAEVLCRI